MPSPAFRPAGSRSPLPCGGFPRNAPVGQPPSGRVPEAPPDSDGASRRSNAFGRMHSLRLMPPAASRGLR